MRAGATISAVGHSALLLSAVLAGQLEPDPPEFEMSFADVSILTEVEFMALTGTKDEAASPLNDVVSSEADPSDDSDAAEPVEEEESSEQENLASRAEPEEDTETVLLPQLRPDLDVMPEMPPPDPTMVEEEPLVIDSTLPVDGEPSPRQSERVASEASPTPPPEVRIEDTAKPETVPDPDNETKQESEEQDAAAREEASTRIVTEAEVRPPSRSSFAPILRPGSMTRPAAPSPSRPEPDTPAEQTETKTDSSEIESKILAAILEDQMEPHSPATVQVSSASDSSEVSAVALRGFQLAIQKCWNVGALSSEAARIIVTLRIRLEKDGRPEPGGVIPVRADSGPQVARKLAFDVAARAVRECLAGGYELPQDKYEQWREIELVFNPEQMRLK